MMKAQQAWPIVAFVGIVTTLIGFGATLPGDARMPPLKGATAWLNSPPLGATELRGKVVLVDFWTYTCINWRRTLPYLRAWDQKYREHGLVIVGVHTPEFSFEKDIDNVRRETQSQRVDYPVAIDSNYAIWNAFSNQYWPALYVVDAQGHIRHRKFGEGDYAQIETNIQQLLTDAGQTGFDRTLVSIDARGAEAAADWEHLATPETYVGHARTERLVSATKDRLGRPQIFTAPRALKRNEWALAGEWTLRKESAVSNQSGDRISFRFHARDLHLVMGPAMRGTTVRFRVLIDGQPPSDANGVDIDATGTGTLDAPRMYHLIRQSAPIADREFEIEFLDAGAEAFSFTFG